MSKDKENSINSHEDGREMWLFMEKRLKDSSGSIMDRFLGKHNKTYYRKNIGLIELFHSL